MSLEAALNANTEVSKAVLAAIQANTEIMAKHNELLSGLASKVPASANTASASTTSAPAADTSKKESAAEKKAREKAEAEAAKSAAAAAEPAKPVVTIESVRDDVGKFLGSSPKGSAEAQAKKEAIKRILTEMGVEKVTELAADKVAEFKGYFDQVVNGEDPFPVAAEEEEDGLL